MTPVEVVVAACLGVLTLVLAWKTLRDKNTVNVGGQVVIGMTTDRNERLAAALRVIVPDEPLLAEWRKNLGDAVDARRRKDPKVSPHLLSLWEQDMAGMGFATHRDAYRALYTKVFRLTELESIAELLVRIPSYRRRMNKIDIKLRIEDRKIGEACWTRVSGGRIAAPPPPAAPAATQPATATAVARFSNPTR